MNTAHALAKVVASFFRKQRQAHSQTGRSRFLSTTGMFAAELEPVLSQCYLAGLKVLRAPNATVDVAVAAAKIHAQELARQLNESTGNMLAEDKPLGDVFGTDRAANIGMQEDKVALERCKGLVAKHRGKRLKWVVDGKPCKMCKRLGGRIRKPGQSFGNDLQGNPILQAPSHVNCKCRLVLVD